MVAPERRRMTPQERRAQIVDIAAEHFRRDGARGASVTAIAREAGVTRSLVYHYFPGQDALLEAAAERDVALLSAATRDDERLGPRLNAVRALEAFVQ
ncbi:helix-turn-helix domain-containing protein, partial [Cutibacterium acnes]